MTMCDGLQDDLIRQLKSLVAALEQAVQSQSSVDEELARLRTENSKLKYQRLHLKRVRLHKPETLCT